MRFIEDDNVRLQLGDLIARLFGLGEFVVGVDEDLSLDCAPLLELAFPVDLGDGGADDNDFCKAEKITGCDNLNRFAKSLLIREKRGGVFGEELRPRLLILE